MIIDSTLENNPNSIVGLYVASIYTLYLRNYSEAEILIQKLDHLIPNNEEVNRLLIYVYFFLRDYNRSLILRKTLKTKRNVFGEKIALEFFSYSYWRIIAPILPVFILLLFSPYWIPALFISLIVLSVLVYAILVKNDIIFYFGMYLFVGCSILILITLLIRFVDVTFFP